MSASLADYVVDLNDYQKGDLIGCGSYGHVFIHKKGDQEFAVKYMTRRDSLMNVFEREVEILASLSHPCIVKLHGVAFPTSKNEEAAIVMKYYSGGDLQHALKEDKLNNTDKAIIIYGLAHAMTYLHSKKVIHRTFGLANVLLDEDNHPAICDFGCARRQTDSTLTQGVMIPIYAAPEMFMEIDYDEKVDVFAFAIQLFQLLGGQLSYKRSMFAVANDVVEGKRNPIPDSASEFMRDLITRCWEQKPEDRPSFSEILYSLQSTLEANPENILPEIDKARVTEFMASLK